MDRSQFPVNKEASKIKGAVSSNRIIILKAGTGSGKTTQIPEMLLKTIEGKIILTQPRVFNVIENANFIAQQFGEVPGENQVSYSTGQAKRIAPKARISLQTEGTLLRRLLSKPEDALKNVGIIIFDEIHERTIESELLLFLLKNKYLKTNSGLKVLIMSATFEPQVFSQYFKEYRSTVLEVPGQSSDYKINFLLPEANANDDDYLAKAVDIIGNVLPPTGDVLVFLPTKKDIASLEYRLFNALGERNIIIAKNYRGIDPAELKLATEEFKKVQISLVRKPLAQRRVILSTNISETGITFPELKYVIDTGWYNGAYYDPFADAQILVKSPISQNTARQRWGRVGRTSPGVVYPLYTETTYKSLSPDNLSRVLTSNLDDFMLYLTKFLQGQDYNSSDLMTLPTPESANRSLSKLQLLDFVSRQTGQLSYLGNLAIGLKGKPQFLKILFSSYLYKVSTPLCIIISLLNSDLESLLDSKRIYPLLAPSLVQNGFFSDYIGLWLIYNQYLDAGDNSNINHRLWCQEYGIDYNKMLQVNEDIINLKEQLFLSGIPLVDDPNLDEMSPSNPQLLQRIKLAIFRGDFINMAQLESPGSDFYVSLTDPNIKGKVIRSFYFSNPNLKAYLPEFITFSSLNISRNPNTGISSYGFELATGLSREEFRQFKKELL